MYSKGLLTDGSLSRACAQGEL